MKILFLNAWYGELRDPLRDYLREAAATVDVFCFQEASVPVLEIADKVFGGFKKYTAEKEFIWRGRSNKYLQAIYVRERLQVLETAAVLAQIENTGLALYVHILEGDRQIHVLNLHGTASPIDKMDSEDRLKQSREIIEFLKGKEGIKIVGGDFNLFPHTESVMMFEKNGYRDLIKEFKIPTTRNHLAWDRFPDNKQLFSDYIFLSKEVELCDFSVPNVEISDHLPLILNIDG